MRRSSAKEIARRQRGNDSYQAGDSVFVYVPKLMRSKTQAKWAGPYLVEEKLTPTTWKVNGKAEHGFNLKRAAVREAGFPEPMESNERGVDGGQMKRGREEDGISGSKHPRLNALLACMPRGDLLWLR